MTTPNTTSNQHPPIEWFDTSHLETHLFHSHNAKTFASPFHPNYRKNLLTLHTNLHNINSTSTHTHMEG